MDTITITFGECAENNAGMQKIGALAAAGFSPEELEAARARFVARGCACELIDLVEAGGVGELAPAAACVLIVRGGADFLAREAGGSADLLLAEQRTLTVDTKARMRGRVVNKRARHNLCFDDTGAEPDYEAGRGRVVAFGAVPRLAEIRAALPVYLGEKARDLKAEGNYYYDAAKCGIGFHGDSERRRVVALRLGAAMPLHYQWYLRGERVGARIPLVLHHSDLYIKSEKAVGTDWKCRNIPTLRHAAGAQKYLA